MAYGSYRTHTLERCKSQPQCFCDKDFSSVGNALGPLAHIPWPTQQPSGANGLQSQWQQGCRTQQSWDGWVPGVSVGTVDSKHLCMHLFCSVHDVCPYAGGYENAFQGKHHLQENCALILVLCAQWPISHAAARRKKVKWPPWKD